MEGRLQVNVNKSKLMIISKEEITGSHLLTNQTAIERVDHCNYLEPSLMRNGLTQGNKNTKKKSQINIQPYEYLLQKSLLTLDTKVMVYNR